MPVKFWHTSLRFWFFLSYLITTVLKYALEFEETTLSSQFVYFHFIRLDENEKNFIGLSPKCYCLRMCYRLTIDIRTYKNLNVKIQIFFKLFFWFGMKFPKYLVKSMRIWSNCAFKSIAIEYVPLNMCNIL